MLSVLSLSGLGRFWGGFFGGETVFSLELVIFEVSNSISIPDRSAAPSRKAFSIIRFVIFVRFGG